MKCLRTYVKDGVLFLVFDSEDKKFNVIDDEGSREIGYAIKKAENNPNIDGVVITSGKPDVFNVGANLKAVVKTCTTWSKAYKASCDCQAIVAAVENCTKPTIAAIMGACLGGGFEVALGCHYRIAVNGGKTVFGLPEVILHLLPGGGGTQRLPRLIGVPSALQMCVTGANVSVERAFELGIVDEVIDYQDDEENHWEKTYNYLEETSIRTVKKWVRGEFKIDRYAQKSYRRRVTDFFLSFSLPRNVLFKRARDQVLRKTLGHYTAPLQIIEAIKKGFDMGIEEGFKAESEAFADLVSSPQFHAILRIFFAQVECKKSKITDLKQPLGKVAIVGVSPIGTAIAQIILAKARLPVILNDTNDDIVHQSIEEIASAFITLVHKKKMLQKEYDHCMSILMPTLTYDEFKDVGIVIETQSHGEDPSALTKEIESVVPKHCVIILNTNGIPISTVMRSCKRPDKIIGMNYLLPVKESQLLEVVVAEQTSNDTFAIAVELGVKQGKTVLSVRDGPGFYVTRILTVAIFEAVALVQESVDVQHLNTLTRLFGFINGVMTLLDVFGVDVISSVAKELVKSFPARFPEAPQLLDDMVKQGFLGKKCGNGIFIYNGDQQTEEPPVNPDLASIITKHRIKSKAFLSDEDIVMRIVTRLVNEALLCLQEGILSSADGGNVGAVLGIGFPPFHGGPFYFVDHYGAARLVVLMKRFSDEYGEHFQPCQLLQEHADDASKTFTIPLSEYQ